MAKSLASRNKEYNGKEILYRGKVVGYIISVDDDETYITAEYAKVKNIRVNLTCEAIDWTPASDREDVGEISVTCEDTEDSEKYYSLHNSYGALEMTDNHSGSWWVDSVIKSDTQKHGIGRAFYEEAEKIAKANGAQRIELGVTGVAATLFWEAMGFKVEEYLETDDEHPCMAKMVKEIM